MTIVELYDEVPINNVIGALTFSPDKIIYLGRFSKKQFETHELPALTKYFETKNIQVCIDCVQIKRNSLNDILSKFETIYLGNQNCQFSIEATGVEDLVLVALGIMYERYPNIRLYRISPRLRSIKSFSISNDEEMMFDVIKSRNSVEENLILHGASINAVVSKEYFTPEGMLGDERFCAQFNVMWRTCCSGIPEIRKQRFSFPNLWNLVTGVFSKLDKTLADREDKNILTVKNELFSEAAQNCRGDLLDAYLRYFEKMVCLRKNSLMIALLSLFLMIE